MIDVGRGGVKYLGETWSSSHRHNSRGIAFGVHFTVKMDELIVATSGAIGQVIGVFLIFPFDVLKTRLQAAKTVPSETCKTQSKGGTSPLAAIYRMFLEEGLMGIYSLFPAKAMSLGLSRFSYYFLYRLITNQYKSLGRLNTLNTLQNIFCGYMAGVCNTIFISPVEKIQVRVLAAPKGVVNNTIMKHIKQIYAVNGLASFYSGWQTNFYTSLTPAISNTTFDQLKVLLLKGRNSLGYVEAFLLGAFSKAVATFLTYPMGRAKTILYNEKLPVSGGQRAPSSSVYTLLVEIYKKQGLIGLYNGLYATIINGVLREAVMLMVKEKVDVAVRSVFDSNEP